MHPSTSLFGGLICNDGPLEYHEECYLDSSLIHLAVDRKNSQKPLDELYAAFKLAHPDVGPGTVAASSAAATQSTISVTGPLSDPIMDHRWDGHFFYFVKF